MLDKRKISTVLVGSCLIFSSCIGLLPGLVGKSKKSNFSFLMLLTGGASTSSSIESSTESITPVESDSGANASLADEVTLAVSADAIDSDEIITISKLAKPSAQRELVPIQAAYKFGPEGLNFNKPVNLEICYNPQELLSQGLSESTTQIYYLDPDNGELASVGGDVDTNTHCVAANIDHFSTYLAAAQVLIPGNNAPTIGGANFVPANPIAGLPLTVRTVIRDIESNGSGAVASAFLYYRVTGSSTFTKVALLPDSFDTTSERYVAKIPAASVTLSGLQYYIEATDNLGKKRKLPANAPVSFTSRTITNTINPVNPLRFNLTNLSMTAGFSRDLVLQARNAAGTYQNIIADSMSVANGIGIVTKPTSSNLRFTAQIKGVGSLTAISGGFSVSTPITVHAGQLDRIEIFDSLGVLITSDIEIVAGQTYQFDVLGYDAYGNSVLILPAFSVLGGIGSVNANGLFTAGATSPMSGSLKADMEGFTDSVNVNIVEPTYSIGGIVSGLNGTIIIQNNAGNTLSINANGPFTFSMSLVTGSPYNVTVLSQPSNHFCSVSNGIGSINNSNVSNVNISCISAPSALSYSDTSSSYILGLPIPPNVATITGSGITFGINPALPQGLNFNSSTGQISGTPTTLQSSTTYSVVAMNVGGSTMTTISIAIIPPPPGTGVPSYSEINIGGNNAYTHPRTIIDNTNSKLIVLTNNYPNNLTICDLDVTNCLSKNYSAGLGIVLSDPFPLIDYVNSKLILVGIISGGFGSVICNLDGTSCSYSMIATNSTLINGLAGIIDTTNSKILIVANRPYYLPGVFGAKVLPTLFRCNLSATSCNEIDISAGQSPGPGVYPSVKIDFINSKLLVVTTNDSLSPMASLFRCNLDGTNCIYKDISAGQGLSSGFHPSAEIDTANSKLLVATWNIANSGKPSLVSCNLDGSSCIASDISAGQGSDSGRFPKLLIDQQNSKLIVATVNGSNSYKPSIFRCSLNGSNCNHIDISAGQSLNNGSIPEAVIDSINGKLILVSDNLRGSFSLFRN